MSRRLFRMILAASCLFLLTGALGTLESWGAPPVTTITVDSTDDPDVSKSTTCKNAAPCTLRRAVVQARGLSSTERPVLIRFNIPTTDPGYDPALGIWKIRLNGITNDDLRELYGKTTIDGATQPGGRTTGPKIVIDGQRKHNLGFYFYLYDGNVVRNVAMQNFKSKHISIESDGNRVENCWFGLSDDGEYLSAGDITTPEEASGVVLSSSSDNNIIRGNTFAGFFSTACSISGTKNVFAANKVGMRADGTVPLPAGYSQHPCEGSSVTWVGGVGITVEGTGNRIGGSVGDRNYFAGLFLDISETSTQSPAIKVWTSKEHLIKNNYIGVSADNKNIGVCGRGLDLASGPDSLKILNNTFSETGLSAIMMNSSVEGNTIQGNIIKRKTQWPGPQGDNPLGEDAIAYGPKTPDALKNFVPAAITSISGKTVQGTSGVGSPCPNCTVELFLDDVNQVKECKKPLKRVMTDAAGNWTATIPNVLLPTQGLRTMSTVLEPLNDLDLEEGTTSNISQLYKIPKVNVTVSDKSAVEPGKNKGAFKFTRDADFGPLTVFYTVGGTAKPGVDYVALSGKVNFPEGVKTKIVQVTVKDDSIKDAGETVKVVLVDRLTYDLGKPKTATITIKDDD